MSFNTVATPPNPKFPKIVETDDDYQAEPLDRTVIAINPDGFTGATGATGPGVVITLAEDPLPGTPIKLVAAGQSITVDGGGNFVFGDLAIPLGTSRSYTFAKPNAANDRCGAGVYVPDCCGGEGGGATGATGGTGPTGATGATGAGIG